MEVSHAPYDADPFNPVKNKEPFDYFGIANDFKTLSRGEGRQLGARWIFSKRWHGSSSRPQTTEMLSLDIDTEPVDADQVESVRSHQRHASAAYNFAVARKDIIWARKAANEYCDTVEELESLLGANAPCKETDPDLWQKLLEGIGAHAASVLATRPRRDIAEMVKGNSITTMNIKSR